jgi:hypothetical protein
MCAEIAQMVEQVIRNDQVVGSNPIFSVITFFLGCGQIGKALTFGVID